MSGERQKNTAQSWERASLQNVEERAKVAQIPSVIFTHPQVKEAAHPCAWHRAHPGSAFR